MDYVTEVDIGTVFTKVAFIKFLVDIVCYFYIFENSSLNQCFRLWNR